MLNEGKSWLSQGNCLDIVLDTFHLPKIPKKAKNSSNIQRKGLPQGLLLPKKTYIGAETLYFYC